MFSLGKTFNRQLNKQETSLSGKRGDAIETSYFISEGVEGLSGEVPLKLRPE